MCKYYSITFRTMRETLFMHYQAILIFR